MAVGAWNTEFKLEEDHKSTQPRVKTQEAQAGGAPGKDRSEEGNTRRYMGKCGWGGRTASADHVEVRALRPPLGIGRILGLICGMV